MCSVENTMWPVCAALMEMSAVSGPTNLTHHDDVRILAQKGFQCGRKGQPAFSLTLDLVDSGQIDLGRIYAVDIDSRLVEDIQAGIQRYWFRSQSGR